MKKIWITSDTHYGHKNIVRGTTSWTQSEDDVASHGIDRTRDFDTLEEHNTALVDNINALVGHDDILYHLGDWSFGGAENIKKFRDQIACQDIRLIFGNHDQHIEPSNSQYRELFSSTEYYKELFYTKVDGEYILKDKAKNRSKRIILSHFAMRVWNKSHKGAIHLYGHSHGSIPDFGRSMDVGVDTNGLKPYSLDDIVKRMVKITPEIVDHHNKNTN